MEPALWTLFLFPVIACLAGGTAAAQAPFAPHADQPDYVVTMVWNFQGETRNRTVMHHGKWTYVGGAGHFFSVDGEGSISVVGGASSVTFERGRTMPDSYDTEPRNTGERQTHLGESCTVWDVWRTKRGPERTHLSCVTDDGIELWWKNVSRKNEVRSSAEATSVVRRPVMPEEVHPSPKLLVVDWWDQNLPAPATKAIPDHETVMELSDDPAKPDKSIRTTRRHGAWQSSEEKVGHFRRSLTVTHDSRRIYLRFAHGDGRPHERLNIVRYGLGSSEASAHTTVQATSFPPRNLDRSETVLGETCSWFDMMPMMDWGQPECLTSDGIILKEEIYGRDGKRSWTAIRLTRRPVAIDEIKPPAELLDPQRWGIE